MSDKSLARTRVPYRDSWLRTFVSGTYGIAGACVKPFSCTRDPVERLARLLLDSLYVERSLGVDTISFLKEERGGSLTNR